MAILGTNGNDTLSSAGTHGFNQTIFGLNGADDIAYTGPEGRIFGGSGSDTIAADYVTTTSLEDLDWLIFGGSGDDSITATSDTTDDFAPSVQSDLLIEGGQGNDTITIDLDIDLYNAGFNTYPSIDAETTVIDSSGDNIVSINNSFTSGDSDLNTLTTVIMGGGDDSVTIDNYGDAENLTPDSDHNIELGGGDDTLVLEDVIGSSTSVVTAGNGNDSLTTTFWGNEGNDNGLAWDVYQDAGAGHDFLDVTFNAYTDNGSNMNGTFDLGGGDDTLRIVSDALANFTINGGQGANTILVDHSGGVGIAGFNGDRLVDVTTGGGKDVIVISIWSMWIRSWITLTMIGRT